MISKFEIERDMTQTTNWSVWERFKTGYLLSIIVAFVLLSCGGSSSTQETTQESDKVAESSYTAPYRDFLTPQYYSDTHFANEVETVLSQLHQEQFALPIQDATQTPTHGEFGAPKGNPIPFEHHPAIDLYRSSDQGNIYAAHEGVVEYFCGADKYRDYIAITKEISNSDGEVIAKLVTIYAHLDLELDAKEGLANARYVQKGEVISKNLYRDTVGGAHLHFEIRYYRASDVGNEEFYGMQSTTLNVPSAGEWEYGYWNPNVGYGFGNPKNHGVGFLAHQKDRLWN